MILLVTQHLVSSGSYEPSFLTPFPHSHLLPFGLGPQTERGSIVLCRILLVKTDMIAQMNTAASLRL